MNKRAENKIFFNCYENFVRFFLWIKVNYNYSLTIIEIHSWNKLKKFYSKQEFYNQVFSKWTFFCFENLTTNFNKSM